MDNNLVNVTSYLPGDCKKRAIDEALNLLNSNGKDFKTWTVLEELLQSFKNVNETIIDPGRILQVCQNHLKTSDEHPVRIISKILILLVEKCDISTIKHELELLVSGLQSTIMCQSSSTHSDEGFQEYRTACTILSLILPTFVKADIVKNPSSLIGVVEALVLSKDEKSIVEGLSFMLPALIPVSGDLGVSFTTVCQSVQKLFETKDPDYQTGIHPGYVSLCCLADILFCSTLQHSILHEPWFLLSIQEGLSNHLAMNRKRAQYLLKRYQDSLAHSELSLNVEIFQDLFLVVETLEEKQIHIIKPVLTKMEKIRDRILVGKKANSSWLTALYKRILGHENLQVVKWGMHHICKLDVSLWPDIGHHDWLHDDFLQGLNHVTLYVRASAGTLPKLAQDLIEYLQKCAQLPLSERQGFFYRFFQGVARNSWNSIGLFHLTLAMSSIANCQLLDGTSLQIVLEFLRSALHTQHPLLRGAVQSFILESVQNLMCISEDNLHWFCLILATINPHECYVRHSQLYVSFIHWLQENYSPPTVSALFVKLLKLHLNPEKNCQQSSVAYSVDVVAVARLAILIFDADMSEPDMIQQLQITLEPLIACHTRLYADEHLLSERIHLVVTLLKQVHFYVEPAPPQDKGKSTILKLVAPLVETLIEYSLKQMSGAADYTTICSILTLLETIAASDAYQPILKTFSGKKMTMVRYMLDQNQVLAKFTAVSLLLIGSGSDTDDIVDVVMSIISRKLHCHPPDRRIEDDSTLDVNWGVFMSHYLAHIWKLIHEHIGQLAPLLNIEEMVEEAVIALDMAGVDAVKQILSCLTQLLPKITTSNPALVRSCLQSSWNLCFDYRRTDHFWGLMQHLMPLVFQSGLMEEVSIRAQIFGFLANLKKMGENILQLFNMAAVRVVDMWINEGFPIVDDLSVKFVVDLLTFGMIHRKDEIVHFETCAFAHSLGNRCPVNSSVNSEDAADGQVRFQGARFLLMLQRDKEEHLKMAAGLCDALLALDRSMASQKTRYFASSHGHRVKHRLWVGLTIIQECLTGTEGCERYLSAIMESALTGLVNDNPQPSVRFLQEWITIRILLTMPQLQGSFWKHMDAAVDQRAGSMVSFLAIIGHTTRCLIGTNRLEAFATEGIPRIIPWAMAQHFTPRLYGSVILEIMWKVCEQCNLQSLMDKYLTLRQMLRVAPEMPNARKNIEKLEQDFYLSVFRADEHFTLETLFYHLPRLAHLASDEWIAVDWFDGVQTTIPQRNAESRLAECQPAEWVARAAGGAPPSDLSSEENKTDGEVGNVQKKITPWKQMLPDVDSLAVSSSRKKNNANSSIDLIVIASLVDRLPNLGGLCRTCEVLGVKHLVLSSLRMTEDRDFVSLSVSSEKWMNILEVKPFQLMDYLAQLKQNGYCVVGAEQTAGSHELNSFKFPQKTALLLGNEKEGIPVELIQHLDVCVEVPQEGVIRSMNVHVTGAIFIWEYVRQQIGLPR